ncbi:bifunctional diaminohydroxyphosphoribosylaminopyrimidine deaminase/5-amino-6-(5-phosphoribosylamino)uracil reductase RibD [Pandoraea apista]|uniref:bifunctional diaminohydroxyphosphoribosylaminopyrimidine deaminase/5-amino-6-(5-phosphoribosylamino)uracil reductase RibD n=1 Tax=Pandoraea apista TaxID=93218 RepID=UPI00058AB53E|nr:bifunctional diaminohydroxyphosphoribosylaminopyrimidine deaminase/5-amino-6-(5-phosphoribosylamino)uracil reductase RibD [Pandoraea apista]AJE99097.1 diaminohydroxyphosphoribosylaminopyrimidine deaminase [Pandoraea apista]AKH73193.1 diaminohydroxyphosphoribosylaminopyrimidine deaminase [Pandoraea apista]AKI61589.1 diaminohydroxyphosphoribosylaminopyrimidine deaminase [Pandoraea apista]
MFSEQDFAYMRRALALAERAMFTTTPNPRVGCVITQDGRVIGEGFTQPAGQDHAEVQAMKDARTRGESLRGATAYVTLEPCSHYGRTPPCAKGLIEAGVKRVIAAMEDPNPLVAGRGLTMLRDAGIEVRCGLLEQEAREMNIGFVARMVRGTPWVRLKVAASLDGKTALNNGASQWLTGPAARADGHAWRARACAILTGIGTVREDDPALTVREVETTRQPLRIVVDSRLEISPTAKVLANGNALVVCANGAPDRVSRLHDLGVEVLDLPNPNGKVELSALLRTLGERQLNEIHVEAGYKLNGSLLREHCVDELLTYLAPCIVGDAQGMFNLPALTSLDDKLTLTFTDVRMIENDLRVMARFRRD